MSNPAGYSGTPLLKKLGLKAGQRAAAINAPANYAELLGPLPAGLVLESQLGEDMDFLHYFQKVRSRLDREFPAMKHALAYSGMLWISWPKKASKVETDIDENAVREIGLAGRLVDVKVAAIDEIWSGLKFMYRVKDRPNK